MERFPFGRRANLPRGVALHPSETKACEEEKVKSERREHNLEEAFKKPQIAST